MKLKDKIKQRLEQVDLEIPATQLDLRLEVKKAILAQAVQRNEDILEE